jgi:serine/threonine protein kinase
VRGDVKIFDFGLAKELSECHRVEGTNVYKLTKRCGSPRYMAPEVFNGQPYNHKVDVYAFGLMLWQICYYETPFESYSYDRLSEEVMGGKNTRPAINEKTTPHAVNKIITSSWSPDISIRPECKVICSSLKEQIVIHCGEQMVDTLDITNRTDASIKAMK